MSIFADELSPELSIDEDVLELTIIKGCFDSTQPFDSNGLAIRF